MKRIRAFAVLTAAMLFMLCACGKTEMEQNTSFQTGSTSDGTENMVNTEDTGTAGIADNSETETTKTLENIAENFVLIPGGTFQMGSPESENWRSEDETQHTVTVSDFYMSVYELTQAEYQEIMEENPSTFSGSDLPVENVTWLDAIRYCNARSEKEGFESAYTIEGQTVIWNRGADGYRLPTEAEWEYACRAGTVTPFNTENSISAEEANYYGHYPYEIEGNYFSQENLTTKPGQYRQTTVAVNSFSPNAWGLYNMHGNVGEWVWDYYGDYPNWWASIPMPIASFLEEYDFTGKTIIPFCSHGGGRFGQSLTAISKLAPEAVMGEALSVHYSGGSGLSDDVEEWLRTNGMIE